MPRAFSSLDDYEKIEEKADKVLEYTAKSSENSLLKKVARKAVYEMSEDEQVHCRLAQRVFDEAMDMYRSGEITWKEFIKDISETLSAIGEETGKIDEEGDVEEEEDEDESDNYDDED